jgi:UDP-3-O-[3-hydroxymyristoyl] glucosamine N-acyltransferase
MAALTVADLASICEGEAQGNIEKKIVGANSLETAEADEISFAVGEKVRSAALQSQAGCLIVSPDFDLDGKWALIRVKDPRASFARALVALYPPSEITPQVHPTAVVAESANVAGDAYVGAHAVIGARARIGRKCFIGEGVSIGDDVLIGDHAKIYPNAALYHHVTIGARVILHSGCVIGADGFGFARVEGRYQKFPQVGTVRIEDDVEIGANSCVDRAALGVTVIGAGSKLDNMVHIAHNCVIGKHVVIAAQTGFAGGVIVEDHAVIGGQVGVGEKARIAAGAIIGSGAGILSFHQVRAGEPVWGTPARPLRKYLKGLANVNKIAEMKTAIRELEQQLSVLQARLN